MQPEAFEEKSSPKPAASWLYVVLLAGVTGGLIGALAMTGFYGFINSPVTERPIAEGHILSIKYEHKPGLMAERHRVGSQPMDIYGKLYDTHIAITWDTHSYDYAEPEIIPFQRLISVRFCDGEKIKLMRTQQ